MMAVAAQHSTIHVAIGIWDWPSMFDIETKMQGIRLDMAEYRRPDPQTAPALAKAAGFKTAVTTRPGMIFPESAGHMTALQRISLNGNFQDERILPVLTSGAATAMWNGFRRVDAA
jgi:peptidoglycan/xylan/chitin deacetylase (PgdA/CDA1 family)